MHRSVSGPVCTMKFRKLSMEKTYNHLIRFPQLTACFPGPLMVCMHAIALHLYSVIVLCAVDHKLSSFANIQIRLKIWMEQTRGFLPLDLLLDVSVQLKCKIVDKVEILKRHEEEFIVIKKEMIQYFHFYIDVIIPKLKAEIKDLEGYLAHTWQQKIYYHYYRSFLITSS